MTTASQRNAAAMQTLIFDLPQHLIDALQAVQHHLKIGYNRTTRLLERMECEKVVSAMDRMGVRAVIDGAQTAGNAET